MDAYLIEAKRTAIGRSHPEKGAFRNVRADRLLSELIRYIVPRILPSEAVDDVYIGCVGQHLEQGKNIARLAWLLAGGADSVPGTTINRLCASSLQAFNFAASTLHASRAETLLAGGVEHMHHVPMAAGLDYNQDLLSRYEFPFTQMGLTAEKVAEIHSISRREQDEFALESHRRAVDAQDKGTFRGEILAIEAEGVKVERDQSPRSDTGFEALSQMKAVFKEGGTVTAGNSSPLNDGASLTLLASSEGARKFGLRKRAEVIDFVAVGVDPLLMGIGPVSAIQKLLKRNNLGIRDIDVLELNEAFASQAIACIRELEISPEKVNPFGGAIALGHPLGCTGTRLVTTLVNGLERLDKEWGIASMCVGHGQGVATLIRRI